MRVDIDDGGVEESLGVEKWPTSDRAVFEVDGGDGTGASGADVISGAASSISSRSERSDSCSLESFNRE